MKCIKVCLHHHHIKYQAADHDPLAGVQVLIYGDCAVNVLPNAQELAQIAATSADTAAAFGIEPRVAMLSYSTFGSGSGPEVDKVRATACQLLLCASSPDFSLSEWRAMTLSSRVYKVSMHVFSKHNRVCTNLESIYWQGDQSTPYCSCLEQRCIIASIYVC